MDKHSFVFIGGLHRSGTTLLHDCLADHPQVSGLTGTGVPMNEGQFLQSVYPPAGTRRKLWPVRYLRSAAPSFVTSRGYGGPGRFGYDPGSFLDETSPKATRANAESIFQAWAPYWDLDRKLLIEKSPPNLVRTRLLQALFPDSYFIILYRHPVPVSYATRRWARIRPLYYLLDHWLVCYERFEADRRHLDRVISLRYEDFVRQPGETLDRIYRFLGQPPVAPTREVSEQINVNYFRRWNEEIERIPLRRRYIDLLRRRFEDRFNRFGYTLGDPFLEGPRGGLLDPPSPEPADSGSRLASGRRG